MDRAKNGKVAGRLGLYVDLIRYLNEKGMEIVYELVEVVW